MKKPTPIPTMAQKRARQEYYLRGLEKQQQEKKKSDNL